MAGHRWCLVLALVVACGADRGSPDASIQTACQTAGAVVSFKSDVVPLIGHCSGELCHGSLAPLTWPRAQLVNVPATDCPDDRVIVKPGDPANSYLIDKLTGVNMCSGVRMPKLRLPLSEADVAKIAAWICQGALDN